MADVSGVPPDGPGPITGGASSGIASSGISSSGIDGIDPDGPQTTIVLLRHGRTRYNAEARLQGQYDSPLDEIGVEQAKLAGEAVRHRFQPDRVITSSFTRTLQTVDAAGLGSLPTDVDDRWREIDFGAYDQRKIRDVYVELGEAWLADPGYEPPGGESLLAMHERVVEACKEIADRHAGQTVVVVSHATAIKSAVAWALRSDVATILTMKINLASISTITDSRMGLLLAGFNELGHLDV